MPRKDGGENSVERQRRRYKEAGLVQINLWVPAGRKEDILRAAANARWEHLKLVGYQHITDEDGEPR